jgi:hypothetical protein
LLLLHVGHQPRSKSMSDTFRLKISRHRGKASVLYNGTLLHNGTKLDRLP